MSEQGCKYYGERHEMLEPCPEEHNDIKEIANNMKKYFMYEHSTTCQFNKIGGIPDSRSCTKCMVRLWLEDFIEDTLKKYD